MATPEEIQRAKELRDIEQSRIGIAEETLSKIQETNNVLRDQVLTLGQDREQMASIRSISTQLGNIAKKNYTTSLSELGTSKLQKQLSKDKATIEKQIGLAKSLSDYYSDSILENEQAIAASLNQQVAEAQELSAELEGVEESSSAIAENTGVKSFAGLANFVKSIPGLKAFSGPFEKAADAARIVKAEGGTGTEAMAAGAEKLKKVGLNAIFAAVGKKLLEINKTQTEFRRLTGQSVSQMDALNDSLATANQFMEQTVSLTKQFGFNASAAFSAINIQEATELSQLMGLTAEEANNFALFSQTAGQNANANTNELIKQVGEINVANKSAVSQKLIFQDIGKTSKAIALTFQGNAVEIGKAATNARILGLNLSQVDKIAGNLLNIEQSIAAEFEAEVISGRQLNLEQARYFALTNDLEGLTSELAKNQSALQGFVNGTRLEQEAIAGALGMSRDEMADMVFQQRAQLDITDEQARKTAGLSEDDFKRLTIQDSINNSLSKLTEILAGPLEMFVDILGIVSAIGAGIGYFIEGAKALAPILLPLVGIMGALYLKSQAKAIMDGISMAFTAAQNFGPAGLAIGAAAAIAAVGYIKSQKVEDGMAPASKGPFTITDGFGATAITAKGDSLAVSPNISRENTRNNNTQLDYEKLANAIAMGAEKGTSRANVTTNLDGSKVSNRIQAPLAMSTRKYSV
jgi:hypothetical protein